MLHTLTIRDLALIECAEISFANGFNVISGETGGGKSLVIAALKLLRGEKGRGEMVRHGAEQLRVDGEFRLGAGVRSQGVAEAVSQLCGIDLSDEFLIVTRIVDAKGRSRARVNGRPVTLTVLRELGSWLLEIHGQGDSRALMRPEIQCETLDAFAGTQDLREQFAKALQVARDCRSRLEEAAGGERERQERLEFLRFQTTETEQLGLEVGEVAKLQQEHRILAHIDRMRELLDGTLHNLQEGEPSAADLLGQASRRLGQASEIDAEMAEASEFLSEAEVNVAEACRAVQSGLARLDLDPSRLTIVEARLADLRRGLSRFGPTEADYLVRVAEIAEELERLTEIADNPQAMEQRLAETVAELVRLGRKLVRARRKIAGSFAASIEAELESLGMAQTTIEVAMEDAFEASEVLDAATSHGPCPVDFVVRINPGEPSRSMRETASGGEMARIVLAIKKCLADQDRVPFLVFDEVDAEIGGRLGFQVGGKLKDVSCYHQLLIVTHLPQVAAFGDAHFQVAKKLVDGRTISQVDLLDVDSVERELAAMSVGEGADAKAIQEARRMISKARS